MRHLSIFLFLAFGFSAGAAEFQALEKFTDSTMQYRLSRNSSATMAFDSLGTLHAAYWSGGIDTRPQAPSHIYHRTWTASAGWSAQQPIDDSEVSGVGHLGGRHPSLAITPDDTVWIAWGDHRHCADAANWIDNIEIYADARPAGGDFSASDIRLTTSGAGTSGDNGYTPKLAIDASGKLHLAWHDYSADPNVADIYLTPTALEALGPLAPFADFRATFSAPGGPEYTVVDLAVDASATRHLVWTGGQGASVDLYYGTAAPGTNAITESVLVAGGTDYFDPPHVAVAPAGDVWIAWGDESGGSAEQVRLLRKRAGQPAFDAPITPDPAAARQYAPSMAFDAAGNLHLAWVDERAGRQVLYAVYDPVAGELAATPIALTPRAGQWSRPSIALDGEDEVYALIEESISIAAGDLWFTTTKKRASAKGWQGYP